MQIMIFIIAQMTLTSSLRGLHVLIALLSNCSTSFTFTTSEGLVAIDVIHFQRMLVLTSAYTGGREEAASEGEGLFLTLSQEFCQSHCNSLSLNR